MPPGKKPLSVRRVIKAVTRPVIKPIERTGLGKAVRKSALGKAVREFKAKTTGITLSTREFDALVRGINNKGWSHEYVGRFNSLTGRQKKLLLAELELERKSHLIQILKQK